MSSISDAILKQRPDLFGNWELGIQNSESRVYNSAFRIPHSELVGTAAACAVLNGGYGRPAAAQASAAASSKPEPIRHFHPAARWLIALAVSSLIGLGTGFLPHRGQSRLEIQPEGEQAMARAASLVQTSMKTVPAVKAVAPELAAAEPKSAKDVKPAEQTAARKVEPRVAQVPAKVAVPQAVAVPAEKPKAEPLKAGVEAKPASALMQVNLKPVFRALAPKALPDSVPAAPQPARQIVSPAPKSTPLMMASAGLTGVSRVEEVLYEAEPTAAAAKESEPVGEKAAATAGGGSPARRAAKEGRALRVEGIFWDRTRPMALINGDIVEVGSRVGALEVVEIKTSSVTVAENGLRRVLYP